MFKNVLCYLLVLASLLFQESNAAPSAFVIAQYTPKLAALAIKIATTVKDGSRAIENGEKLIQTVVDFAEGSVNKELDDFNSMVTEKEAEAEKSNKDISSCITQEKTDVQKINPTTLDVCRNVENIEALKMIVTELAKEEISLTLAVNLCIIKHPIFGSKLKVCFDEKISDVENKITMFNDMVQETIHYTQEECFNCMSKNSKNLDDAIEDISIDFNVCVAKKLESFSF